MVSPISLRPKTEWATTFARAALLEDVGGERVAVLKEVDRQLDRALGAIAAAREAVFAMVSLAIRISNVEVMRQHTSDH